MPKFQKRQSPRIKSTPTKKEISTPTKKTASIKKTRFTVSPILEEKSSTPKKRQVKTPTKNARKEHISFTDIDITPVKVSSTKNILDQFFLIEAQVKNQIDQVEEPSRELNDLSFIRNSFKPNKNGKDIISSTPAKPGAGKDFEEFLKSIDNDISGISDSINPSNVGIDIENSKKDSTVNKRSSARLRSQSKVQDDPATTKKAKLSKSTASPLKSRNVNKTQKRQASKASTDDNPIKKRPGRPSKKIDNEKAELLQKQRDDLYKRLENFKFTEEIL
ncbi:hypothetical protein CONCODRAFT_77013 [Conidiobolus coronatus NRRL 28638]|uniref:Uncharacterized protein n=1 Tax=Conidiobolus coronatus (strain ATCC 28846 / CBS 209.66 / NRRL 28638) TaxID=796925 RepID=A0A137PGM6_CONC2|nr:hypothetical protein CONCODRAFT_77013 [Conidiobolus coronatus NRRL 28638]|eukprot:KXN74159.1 hypothetical protein CONCODRAFT_77013 [Conidiobolus coronatus NRRL 28638]